MKFTLKFVKFSFVLADLFVLHSSLFKLIVLVLEDFVRTALVSEGLLASVSFSIDTVKIGLEGSNGLLLFSLHQANLFFKHVNLSSE